jgi:hypothetical protein
MVMRSALYIEPYPDSELSDFLQKNFDLVYANDAASAISALKSKRFDLIVMEVSLDNNSLHLFRNSQYWETGLRLMELMRLKLIKIPAGGEPLIIVISYLALMEAKERIQELCGRPFRKDIDYGPKGKDNKKTKLRWPLYFEKHPDIEEVIDSIKHHLVVY